MVASEGSSSPFQSGGGIDLRDLGSLGSDRDFFSTTAPSWVTIERSAAAFASLEAFRSLLASLPLSKLTVERNVETLAIDAESISLLLLVLCDGDMGVCECSGSLLVAVYMLVGGGHTSEGMCLYVVDHVDDVVDHIDSVMSVYVWSV